MLRPSRRIGTAELHKGAIGLHMSTCEKITRIKSHVYLELSAKRASVRTYINMHARKKLTFFYKNYLFAKDTACTREKNRQ